MSVPISSNDAATARTWSRNTCASLQPPKMTNGVSSQTSDGGGSTTVVTPNCNRKQRRQKRKKRLTLSFEQSMKDSERPDSPIAVWTRLTKAPFILMKIKPNQTQNNAAPPLLSETF